MIIIQFDGSMENCEICGSGTYDPVLITFTARRDGFAMCPRCFGVVFPHGVDNSK